MAVCVFDGNTDMYGLGIRIGFYIQWYSAILASWLAPSEVASIRLTINLFIAATFLALLIQVIKNVSNLQIVEIYIILLLTFGYYLFLVPLYIWRLLTSCNPALDPSRFPLVRPGRVYSVLSFLLLTAVASFQLWFWFAQVPQLSRQGCEEYGFFFARIRLNEKAFQVVNIVFYFLLLISCAIVLLISISLKLKMVEERKTPQLREEQIESLQKLHTMSNVAVASTVLAATELTIRWNKIRSVNSLLSAGQTIPLFLGIGTVVRILYVFRFFEPTDDDRRPYLRPIGPTIVPLQAVHPPIDRFPRQERMPLPARVDAIPLPGRMPRRH